jgi:long-chain acyl-CoA synthetase
LRCASRERSEERYTYGDFRECVLRAAAFLKTKGSRRASGGALSQNSPEWGMAYFGIIRTGATAIPLEKESATEEIATLLRLGQASALLVSGELLEEHRDLEKIEGVPGYSFEDVFRLLPEATEQKRITELPESVQPSTVASILFTSGTTGNPKGVMLTHRNFASLVAKLLSVYDIDHDDGMLSVLPLHHSFEFTTGLSFRSREGPRSCTSTR